MSGHSDKTPEELLKRLDLLEKKYKGKKGTEKRNQAKTRKDKKVLTREEKETALKELRKEYELKRCGSTCYADFDSKSVIVKK